MLNQKSELQKAMEKHKEHQVKKELEQQKQESKSALERVIEERARRLETVRNVTEMDALPWHLLLSLGGVCYEQSYAKHHVCVLPFTKLTVNAK